MEHGSAKTILVIEDSPVVQHLFRAVLAPQGFELVFADDGEAGLEAALALVPDAILLDIGLPKLDGWEVLTRLRADSSLAHVAVLVVTAHAQPSFAAAAERYGADGFVTKPFRPGDLRDHVLALLAQAPLRVVSGL